ncbi:MAG: ABC transporter ATP-binding protein [Candidatus Dormibacteria bacterium]
MTAPETAGADRPELILAAAGLTKAYQETRVLDGVDLEVPPGTFLVLLGPSGSGKTTLLRCIAGTERLSSGTLRIAGREVAGPHTHLPPERRHLSMVFQDYALWPHMTAVENVGFALRRLRVGRTERRTRSLEMLERVGISHLADQYPSRLSGGQQQRVALARALVAGSPLLLCDEPLSNLDAHLREQLRVEIATLTRDRGATVVYITHDQQEAFALADQLAVIHQGRILQIGSPEQVYRKPASPFVARFTGLAGSLAARVVASAGADRVRVRCGEAEVEATAMCDFLPGEPVHLLIRADALSIGSNRGGALTGVVRDSSFRSGAYDHVVDLAGGSRLTGVRANGRSARGANVEVLIDPVGCLAFPDPGVVESSVPARPQLPGEVDGVPAWSAGGADLTGAPA